MKPSTCLSCGSEQVNILSVPPHNHDRGSEWVTKLECPNCGHVEWFD